MEPEPLTIADLGELVWRGIHDLRSQNRTEKGYSIHVSCDDWMALLLEARNEYAAYSYSPQHETGTLFGLPLVADRTCGPREVRLVHVVSLQSPS